MRAFNSTNWAAEGFGPVFKVIITEIGTAKVINNPPTFASFPKDIEYYQDVPYFDQYFEATAVDSDGLVAKVEVEVLTVLPDGWINVSQETDKASFRFFPFTGLPLGSVIFKVTATDNHGATVMKMFTVKIVPVPLVVEKELPKIANIT